MPSHHSSSRMLPSHHLLSRDDCVSCDSTPSCNCSSGEQCILTSRTCNQCATITCIKGSSSSSSTINPGVIAGPVVAVLVIASLGLFWWMRRKKRRDLARLEELAERARKAEQAGFQLSHPGSPAPGSASGRSGSHHRSSSPLPPPSASRRSPLPPAPVNAEYYDENGATIRVYNGNKGTINLDPKSALRSGAGDPFSDQQSISTMGSGGTANIIPIQWIPPSKSDEALSKAYPADNGPRPGQGQGQSAAARLDAARQNLFAPRRPARSPDLHLRLNTDSSAAGSSISNLRSPELSSSIRDSYLSGNSAAPSYWSGQSDVHLDAPRIFTSKQVQVGRLQQAEMVQFGGGAGAGAGAGAGGRSQQLIEQLGHQGILSPVRDEEGVETDSFKRIDYHRDAQSSLSSTFDTGNGESSMRTLTPANRRLVSEYDNGYDDQSGYEYEYGGDEEGLRSDEPSSAGAGDLRFSMGSLAYRDSVSTVGTSRYLASAISTGFSSSSSPAKGYSNLPPPLPRAAASGLGQGQGERESMMSGKSFADSVLGSFPMIPPGQAQGQGQGGYDNRPGLSSMPSGLPQSTSVATLDHIANATISRPPPTYRSPSIAAGGATKAPRPETQASVADSFLGSFPFVPPNVDDLAGLPSAALPSAVITGHGHGGSNGMAAGLRGVSTTSEGLGEFDFRLDDERDRPPLPQAPARRK